MIRSIALAASVLALASVATAFDGNRQRSSRDVQGSIAWSTRDHNGDRFGIVFEFSDRGLGVHASYSQDRYGRYRPNDRYDRRPCPPVYDYDHYGHGRYDREHFYSYDEWNDWHEWQHHWDDDHHWFYDHDDRDRAWREFLYERSYAEFEHDQRHYRSRHDRRHNDDFQFGWSYGKSDKYYDKLRERNREYRKEREKALEKQREHDREHEKERKKQRKKDRKHDKDHDKRS
ncbi:MAG: hypothetical protein IH945_00995 [Armatimonadetes bacterium]|nr:hypothetical protein [Armatimonadota bacterium]